MEILSLDIPETEIINQLYFLPSPTDLNQFLLSMTNFAKIWQYFNQNLNLGQVQKETLHTFKLKKL